MITLDQLKQQIIAAEAEWMIEVHGEDTDEANHYIQGMIDEINSANDLSGIANYYHNSGYSIEKSYECIIGQLMLDCEFTIVRS